MIENVEGLRLEFKRIVIGERDSLDRRQIEVVDRVCGHRIPRSGRKGSNASPNVVSVWIGRNITNSVATGVFDSGDIAGLVLVSG